MRRTGLHNLPPCAALCSVYELADTPSSQEGGKQQEKKQEGRRGRMAGMVAAAGWDCDYFCGGENCGDPAPDGRGWTAQIAPPLPVRAAAQAVGAGFPRAPQGQMLRA